jgi:hypothetical protein
VVGLATEAAALHEQRLTTGGAAQLLGALAALHRGRGVAVHHCHALAARAAHVHEVRVGALHEATALVAHALRAHGGVAEISVEEAHDENGGGTF